MSAKGQLDWLETRLEILLEMNFGDVAAPESDGDWPLVIAGERRYFRVDPDNETAFLFIGGAAEFLTSARTYFQRLTTGKCPSDDALEGYTHSLALAVEQLTQAQAILGRSTNRCNECENKAATRSSASANGGFNSRKFKKKEQVKIALAAYESMKDPTGYVKFTATCDRVARSLESRGIFKSISGKTVGRMIDQFGQR
jgi:hypothetical protein